MWNQLTQDPALPEITVVLSILVGFAIWQRLNKTVLAMVAVYIFYLGYVLVAPPKEEVVLYQPPLINIATESVFIDEVEEIAEESLKADLVIETERAEKVLSTESKPVISTDTIDTSIPAIVSTVKVKRAEDIPETQVPISKKEQTTTVEEYPLQVNSLMVCTAVINRQAFGTNDKFSNDLDRLYCISGIRNLNQEQTIHYKWYHNRVLRSNVPIRIKRSYNWRSWSYITLRPFLTGNWKVIIEDSLGTRLDSVLFTVVEADSIPSSAD